MAIQKTLTTVHGAEIKDAYIRVEAIRLVHKTAIEFNLCIYANPSKPMIYGTSVECGYDLLGENPMAQAYQHLKTLPEFSDAIDC